MKKIRVALLFGGPSAEHDISLLSARSIAKAIDTSRYDLVPIAISREGRWATQGGSLPELMEIPQELDRLHASQNHRFPFPQEIFREIDVVFPALHGPYGEDGTVQGLLEIARVPYVGAGVLASAIGMDKAVMKMVFKQHGLPTVDFRIEKSTPERNEEIFQEVEGSFGYPCFVKPARGGSSIGISKVCSREELNMAMQVAAQFDHKVVIERGIEGREIECSVLGNRNPAASLPGEVVVCREFYDYEAKYSDKGTHFLIPAPLTESQVHEVQQFSVQAFKAIDCTGMARVDFFLRKEDNKLFVNEINTIPGFTAVSMYPKLWEASGVSFSVLIDRLIQLALEHHQEWGS
ncbi:MAG: D-alanine--D-alanine ligase [Chloroflexi bacterium]|nr:D-alanine--D-alanine ligase [Chloroflexota bacterium]